MKRLTPPSRRRVRDDCRAWDMPRRGDDVHAEYELTAAGRLALRMLRRLGGTEVPEGRSASGHGGDEAA
jgi:hypothetical protein